MCQPRLHRGLWHSEGQLQAGVPSDQKIVESGPEVGGSSARGVSRANGAGAGNTERLPAGGPAGRLPEQGALNWLQERMEGNGLGEGMAGGGSGFEHVLSP